MRLVRTIVLGGWLLACGGRSELGAAIAVDGGVTSEAAPSESSAILVNDCAPNDGPAIAIVIAPAATCDAPFAPVESATTLRFYGAVVPVTVGSFAIGDGSIAAESGALVCDSTTCTAATNGTLTITHLQFAETLLFKVSGTYTLTLADGTSRAGSFVATVCQNPIQCG